MRHNNNFFKLRGPELPTKWPLPCPVQAKQATKLKLIYDVSPIFCYQLQNFNNQYFLPKYIRYIQLIAYQKD